MTAVRLFRWIGAVTMLFACGSAVGASTDTTGYVDGTAAFSVQFGDDVISQRIMAVTAMPNRPVRIAIPTDTTMRGYRINAPNETITPISDRQWRFTAPDDPGLYSVTVADTTTSSSVRLKVFVLTPWDHNGQRLQGYRIGRYEQEPRRGLTTYNPPEGFIRITDENRTVRVSPNFRLEQFLCKQTDRTPQFALLRTQLLQRLEEILRTVNKRGHPVSTLHVMSGYRTPYYNRVIGNTTVYSRHLYGDAADIFVDETGNERMDDLNGDGRVDEADARYLARLVRQIPTRGDDQFNGGLSTYETAPHRGPFVHLDLRGYRARW